MRHSFNRTPILKEVSKAASIIPDIEDETIKTDFFIQDEIELSVGKGGQKPAVDAMIQISNKDDKAVACVPVEMKIDMDTKHYSQIACYMNKLSTAKDVADSVLVGIIIDSRQFRLAFSVYYDENSGSIPLPVVHISPPIEWRSDHSFHSIHPQSMLTLACTFLIGQLKRVPFPKEYSTICGEPSATKIIEMGNILIKKPHVIHKPYREIEVSLKRQLEEQRKKINKLEEEMETIKEAIKRRKIDAVSM